MDGYLVSFLVQELNVVAALHGELADTLEDAHDHTLFDVGMHALDGLTYRTSILCTSVLCTQHFANFCQVKFHCAATQLCQIGHQRVCQPSVDRV